MEVLLNKIDKICDKIYINKISLNYIPEEEKQATKQKIKELEIKYNILFEKLLKTI